MARSTRVTISFPGKLWESVSVHAHRMRLRSGAQLLVTLARMAVEAMDRNWASHEEQSIQDEIARMFDDYTYWEPTPCGEVPKKPRSMSFENFESKDFYGRMGYLSTEDAEGDAEGVAKAEEGSECDAPDGADALGLDDAE